MWLKQVITHGLVLVVGQLEVFQCQLFHYVLGKAIPTDDGNWEKAVLFHNIHTSVSVRSRTNPGIYTLGERERANLVTLKESCFEAL